MVINPASQIPMLDGYTELGLVGEVLGVARQTGHFYAFKVGAFPGMRRFGLSFPTYLVPDEEIAAFAAAQESKGNTRLRSQDHHPVDKDAVPALEGWMSLPEAAEVLAVVPMTLNYMIEHGQFTVIRRANRRNSLALRTEEVRALHARRLRAWAVSNGAQDIEDLDALDAAYRSSKAPVTHS